MALAPRPTRTPTLSFSLSLPSLFCTGISSPGLTSWSTEPKSQRASAGGRAAADEKLLALRSHSTSKNTIRPRREREREGERGGGTVSTKCKFNFSSRSQQCHKMVLLLLPSLSSLWRRRKWHNATSNFALPFLTSRCSVQI